jgi:hypothetical protein
MIKISTKRVTAAAVALLLVLPAGLVLRAAEKSVRRTFCDSVHDSYRVTGPDGRAYATWHPPSVKIWGVIDCHFGHEHGDDPRTSIANSKLPPFDYVNSLAGRSEAHTGFKVFVVNDDGRGGRFRMVVHQGSSSNNAFYENRHELFIDYINDDGRELHTMLLGHFGQSSKFKAGCDGNVQPVDLAASKNGFADGERVIPDTNCLVEGRLPYEVWGASQAIRGLDGHALATFKPYFSILNPNRVFRRDGPDRLARSDVEASTGRSSESTRSLYKGTQREVYENVFQIDNEGGPDRVWTDVDGKVEAGSCPTCIQQFICSSRSNKAEPTVIFRTAEDYDDGTVHAPN